MQTSNRSFGRYRRAAGAALFFVGLLTGSSLACADTKVEPEPVTRAALDRATKSIDPKMQLPGWLRTVVLLIRAGKYGEARDVTAVNASAQERGARMRYVEGLILKHQGNYAEAATLFRSLLADIPKSRTLRSELAHTLFLAREDAAARHHYDLLLTASDDERTAALYRHRLANINQRRTFRLGGYIALSPSSNINNGTSEETIELLGVPFEIDQASRKKSGFGLAGGLHGSWRIDASTDWGVQVAAGVDTLNYKDREFDTLVTSLSVIPERKFSWGHVGLGLASSRQFRGGSPSDLRIGVKGELFIRPSKSLQVSLAAELMDVAYDRWDWLDGTFLTTDLKVTKGLSSTQTIFGFAGFDQVTAPTPHNAYTRPLLGLGLYKEWSRGIVIYAEARVADYRYEGNAPGSPVPRHDKEIKLLMKLLKRDFSWAGFAPRLGLTWGQRRSNIAFYQSDQLGADLHLTREF